MDATGGPGHVEGMEPTDLDTALTIAAPPVSASTDQLDAVLRELVAASESPRPRRRSSRLAVAGAVVVGLLGVGTVATAAGVLPGWTMLTTSSGQTCEVAVEVSLLHPGDGEPISATFSRAEQEASLAAAQAFLDDLDYDTIDHDRAIARWQAVEADVRAGEPPDERQPELTGDDLEVHAVTWVVVQRMRADLAARGLDIRAIDVTTTSTGCDL